MITKFEKGDEVYVNIEYYAEYEGIIYMVLTDDEAGKYIVMDDDACRDVVNEEDIMLLKHYRRKKIINELI